MIIDGELVEANNSATFPIINPATGEIVDTAPKGAREDAKRAIDAAYEAFQGWSSTPASERAKLLFKAAQIVRDNQKELAQCDTMEQGKPIPESMGEIARFSELCEYYAGIATQARGITQNIAQNIYCDVVKQPVGVVGGITPWNFPVSLFAFKLAPALAAGNTFVLKPASTTPLTDLKIVDLMGKVGIPKGVVNVVTGPGSVVGQEFLDNSKVRKIAFTGETGTGKHIMEACARSVKRVTLELGGSDPMIVCNDVDVDLAVKGAISGRFRNCGQICIAMKRLIIFKDVYEVFTRKMTEAVQRIKVGNGLVAGTTMGPLNNEAQRETIEDQVKDAREHGAKAMSGGARPVGREFEKGYFYLPTLLTDVPADSKVATEETFGPVLPMFSVPDLDEALRLANSTQYGLGSSIWTTNLTTARVAAEKLEAGTVWINSPPLLRVEIPFGGFKQSGLGKELGTEGLEAYLETKAIYADVSGKSKPWW